jgi:CRISPR-associated protein Cas1
VFEIMARKLFITYDQHMRLLKFRGDGLSLRQIAELEHLSISAVWTWCRRKPVNLSRPPFYLRASTDDHFKSERYWQQRLPKERNSVLTVGGSGSALRVRNGELSILEDKHEQRFLPGTHPFKAIVVESFGGWITFDALSWINRHNISLIVLCDGEPVAVPANIPLYNVELRQQQYAASLEPLPIARRILTQKIISGRLAGRLSKVAAAQYTYDAAQAPDLRTLLMVEANAAFEYYKAMPLELRHKPKLWPHAWKTWTARFSPIAAESRRSPRNAADPMNAVLNLAYTVAVNQLTRVLASHGLDPACGFLHSLKDYRASLAYDALELVRADIDTRILSFLASRLWSRADFPVLPSGVVRLQPSLARVVAARATLPQITANAAAAWLAAAITGTAKPASQQAISRAIEGRKRARTARYHPR